MTSGMRARTCTEIGVALALVLMPGLALAHQLYLAVKAQGNGRKGTQALMMALENISGIKR